MTLLISVDFYLTSHLDGEAKVLPALKVFRLLKKSLQINNIDSLSLLDKTKFLYYINKVIGVHCLCISLSKALDIFAIAYKKVIQISLVGTRSLYVPDLCEG